VRTGIERSGFGVRGSGFGHLWKRPQCKPILISSLNLCVLRASVVNPFLRDLRGLRLWFRLSFSISD